jgi:hypothetical protein
MYTDTQLNRLERLEGAVNLLLDRLGDATQDLDPKSPSRPTVPVAPVTEERSRGVSLDDDATAPVFVLRDLAAESGSFSQLDGHQQETFGDEDIIQSGVISLNDATLLMRM